MFGVVKIFCFGCGWWVWNGIVVNSFWKVEVGVLYLLLVGGFECGECY